MKLCALLSLTMLLVSANATIETFGRFVVGGSCDELAKDYLQLIYLEAGWMLNETISRLEELLTTVLWAMPALNLKPDYTFARPRYPCCDDELVKPNRSSSRVQAQQRSLQRRKAALRPKIYEATQDEHAFDSEDLSDAYIEDRPGSDHFPFEQAVTTILPEVLSWEWTFPSTFLTFASFITRGMYEAEDGSTVFNATFFAKAVQAVLKQVRLVYDLYDEPINWEHETDDQWIFYKDLRRIASNRPSAWRLHTPRENWTRYENSVVNERKNKPQRTEILCRDSWIRKSDYHGDGPLVTVFNASEHLRYDGRTSSNQGGAFSPDELWFNLAAQTPPRGPAAYHAPKRPHAPAAQFFDNLPGRISRAVVFDSRAWQLSGLQKHAFSPGLVMPSGRVEGGSVSSLHLYYSMVNNLDLWHEGWTLPRLIGTDAAVTMLDLSLMVVHSSVKGGTLKRERGVFDYPQSETHDLLRQIQRNTLEHFKWSDNFTSSEDRYWANWDDSTSLLFLIVAYAHRFDDFSEGWASPFVHTIQRCMKDEVCQALYQARYERFMRK